MLSNLLSWESLAVVVVIVAAVAWASRPVQRATHKITFRAYLPDVWEAFVPRRGSPSYLDMVDRHEFDEGADGNGIMVFKSGQRLRFETTHADPSGPVWTAAWRSVEIDRDGVFVGDPYETAMELREVPDGTEITLRYTFYKGDARGLKVRLGRILRPLSRVTAGMLLRQAVEKSGALARYEGDHGRPPRPASFAGMPLTRNSLLLFALGFASFVWMSGFWAGCAILAILVVHELGHVLAMRAYGDRTSAFYLVPFMGGVAIGQKQLDSDWKLVVMVLAGPFAGLLSALAALALFVQTDIDWFISVAALAAIVNVANLLPIPILDGGQVFTALLRPYLPHRIAQWVSIGLLLAGAVAGAWIGSALLLVLFTLSAVLQASFPTPPESVSRRPLGHAGVALSTAMLLSLAVALLSVFLAIDAAAPYLDNPLRFLDAGPFT